MIHMSIVESGDIDNNENWLDELTASENKKIPNDVYKIYFVYKYVKKGFDKDAAMKDRRWDEPNLARGTAIAKKILAYFRGDVRQAARAVLEIGRYYEEKFDGPWSLAAVYGRLTDWEEGRLVK